MKKYKDLSEDSMWSRRKYENWSSYLTEKN